MSQEEDSKEQVLFILDQALKSNSLDQIKKMLEEIKDITQNNLKNI